MEQLPYSTLVPGEVAQYMLRGGATFGLFSVGFLYSLWLYGQRKTTLELVSTF